MAEQIPSLEGSSTPQVQDPDTSFSGDFKKIEAFQSLLPKYAGENPYTFKKRLINDDSAFQEFSEDYWKANETTQIRGLAQEDPEQYQALKNRYKKNLRKDLNASSYAGESEKDTLIDRTTSLRRSPEELPIETYKGLIRKSPRIYEEFGLVEDKEFIYGDSRDDNITFAQQVASNPELHRKLVGHRYSQFQDALTNSFNNANLVNDPAKKTQAWVIYDNFGSEGLTQYINGLQSEDFEEDILTRTKTKDQAQQYFSQAKINDQSAFDLVENFVTGGDQPLTFQPIQPRDDLTVDVPADSNGYTNLFYDVNDQKEFTDRDFNGVSKKFLETFAPEDYQKFLNVKNIDKEGEYSQEYRDLTFNVYEAAHSTKLFGIKDLQKTVMQYGEYVGDGKEPRYRIDYNSAPAKVKLAIDALRHDDESDYMFQFMEDGVYDFRPKRRETAQQNFDSVKNFMFATKTELHEDEDGELQARQVADNSGLWGAWNTVATLGLGAADMVNRYFFEPAVRTAGELTQHEGTEAFASHLKDWTGVDMSTGLSSETDGAVPNAIGEVAPFIQYMGSMMIGGSAIIRGGAKAFSAITNAKRAMDVQRYAGKMMGSSRLQAMAGKLNHAVKNKSPWATGSLTKQSPWVTGAGVFYTGGAAIEATQPKEVSFLNTVPQFLGHEPTNDVTKLYKTASDAGRVGMDVGASLVMDGFFDSLIAGSKFFTAKAGQKYFGRKKFKGIQYLPEGHPERTADFGGYRVVDEPQFRHDLREFWTNLTSDLDRLPIGSVGETMAKGISKGTAHTSLHDFTRTFIDDNDYVTTNIRGDIEDNIRFLNKNLGDGVELSDSQVADLVDEQYGYFINNLSDQMYGTLRGSSEDLPLKVAQTLDEQVPTVGRFEVDGRPLRPAEINDYPDKNLVVKGNEVYEVNSNYWTIDLANNLRTKGLSDTKESVIRRKVDALGEDKTAQQVEQITQRADETIGTPVEVDGKIGYVVDFDDSEYIIRTTDGELSKTSLSSQVDTKQFIDKIVKGNNIQNENLGFHGGNLEFKAEGWGSARKGSDVPFTGYYFYKDFESALDRGNRTTGEKEVQAVDFSEYNTYKPETSSEYHNVRTSLKRVPSIGTPERYRKALDDTIEDLKEGKRYGWNDGTLLLQIQSNREAIERALLRNSELVDSKSFDSKNVVDTAETVIMKELGYEGIDVRNTKVLEGDANPNSAEFGSVLFDLKGKPNTVFPTKKAVDEISIQKANNTLKDQYVKRVSDTAKSLAKTVNKKTRLDFC